MRSSIARRHHAEALDSGARAFGVCRPDEMPRAGRINRDPEPRIILLGGPGRLDLTPQSKGATCVVDLTPRLPVVLDLTLVLERPRLKRQSETSLLKTSARDPHDDNLKYRAGVLDLERLGIASDHMK